MKWLLYKVFVWWTDPDLQELNDSQIIYIPFWENSWCFCLMEIPSILVSYNISKIMKIILRVLLFFSSFLNDSPLNISHDLYAMWKWPFKLAGCPCPIEICKLSQSSKSRFSLFCNVPISVCRKYISKILDANSWAPDTLELTYVRILKPNSISTIILPNKQANF